MYLGRLPRLGTTAGALLAGLSLVVSIPRVCAQPPAGGGFNPAAFQKFREQHKYTFQLRTMVTAGLTELERVKSTQLTPDQAKKVLSVLTPLRKQPKLTQDQAKATIQKLQRILTQRQLTAVDRVLQRSQRPFGGRPGAGAPPGGPGGAPGAGAGPGMGARPRQQPGPGARPRFDPTRMQNFNPFNPAKDSPRYQQEKERNDKLFEFLSARAAGKAAKLDLRPPGPPPAGPPPR